MDKKIIIDGNHAILGRLASYAAKQALLGKEVVVVNCDGVVISGKSRMIINEYKISRTRGGSSLRGPFFPKQPERIVKRTIRGMLSHRQGRGEAALDRVFCYDEVPTEYVQSKKIIAGKEKNNQIITLKELEQEL